MIPGGKNHAVHLKAILVAIQLVKRSGSFGIREEGTNLFGNSLPVTVGFRFLQTASDRGAGSPRQIH
jgi:hypothetical protein